MTAKTTNERQTTRRTKLNQIARNAGFETWTKYETETIEKGKIEMNNTDLAWKIYSIVSGADNKQEINETISAIEDWLNDGEPVDFSKTSVNKVAQEFKEYYYV